MPRWSTRRPLVEIPTRERRTPLTPIHASPERTKLHHAHTGSVTYALVLGLLIGLAVATPADAATTAATSLSSVIGSLTDWVVGILAGLATLFLTLAGIRYLTAGGDPVQVERAKVALRSAMIGYALAALAPLLVSILQSVVGG
jgi:hypothetical protein